MRPGVRHYPGAVVRYLDEKFVWTVEFGSHRDHPVVAAHEGVHDGVADGLCNRELDVTAIRPPASAYSPTLLRASVTLPGWPCVLNSSGGRSKLESSAVTRPSSIPASGAALRCSSLGSCPPGGDQGARRVAAAVALMVVDYPTIDRATPNRPRIREGQRYLPSGVRNSCFAWKAAAPRDTGQARSVDGRHPASRTLVWAVMWRVNSPSEAAWLRRNAKHLPVQSGSKGASVTTPGQLARPRRETQDRRSEPHGSCNEARCRCAPIQSVARDVFAA